MICFECYGVEMFVIMVDFDYFKNINDICGYVVGDVVLCEVVKVM